MDAKPLLFMQQHLDALHDRHLYRQLRTVGAGAEPWVEVNGRSILNLSSNNYLGLSTRPELKAAAAAAAEVEGCGSGSSRLVAGNSERHLVLERRLAGFKHSESALLFNSGYSANVGIISSLVSAGDLILSDQLNHASIIDGCRLSRAQCKIFPHCNVAALEELLVLGLHLARRDIVDNRVAKNIAQRVVFRDILGRAADDIGQLDLVPARVRVRLVLLAKPAVRGLAELKAGDLDPGPPGEGQIPPTDRLAVTIAEREDLPGGGTTITAITGPGADGARAGGGMGCRRTSVGCSSRGGRRTSP